MTLRFFVLQAHYRSTISFSNEALQAAQSGYLKLMNGLKALDELPCPENDGVGMDQDMAARIKHSCDRCYEAMNDDFNTAQTIAMLFNLLKSINALQNGQLSPDLLGPTAFENLKNTYATFVQDILGLRQESSVSATALLDILLGLYSQAKVQKQYDQVDAIRAQLQELGIALQDTPMGVQWRYA
jgi:cysteinyl-tRNA synthetase